MSEPWNEFTLKRPPLLTVPVKDAQFVARLHTCIRNYQQRNQEPVKEFDYTAALLSRLMARRKNSFRNMIGFRAIRKLNTALCRLLRLDINREIDNLRSTLPDVVLSDDLKNEVPTRNCLDYVLLRLLGAHHLHLRIHSCCLEAADYFMRLLRQNYFLEFNALLLAVFAKLTSLNVLKHKKCMHLYNQLLSERPHFLHCGKHFLATEFEFPTHLSSIEFVAKDLTASVNTPIDPLSVATQNLSLPKRVKTDIGIAISRTTKQPKFDIGRLETAKDVKKFIANESAARKRKLDGCVTKHILNHEWLGVVKMFERKTQAKENQKAVNIFKKFIGKKV